MSVHQPLMECQGVGWMPCSLHNSGMCKDCQGPCSNRKSGNTHKIPPHTPGSPVNMLAEAPASLMPKSPPTTPLATSRAVAVQVCRPGGGEGSFVSCPQQGGRANPQG